MPIYCVLQLCSDGGGKKGIFTSNELQQNKRKIILLPYNFGSWFVGFVSLRVELYGSRLPYYNMRLVDYVPDLFIHYLTFAVCTHTAHSFKDMRSTFCCLSVASTSNSMCLHAHDDANDDYFFFTFLLRTFNEEKNTISRAHSGFSHMERSLQISHAGIFAQAIHFTHFKCLHWKLDVSVSDYEIFVFLKIKWFTSFICVHLRAFEFIFPLVNQSIQVQL